MLFQIFVGPCESSVFVRTSKHLKLIIAAQQLRTRECSDLDILLYVSAGQPVIEATTNVRLGCFQWNYFGLAEQFAAAGLDPWYSEWSNVHDFTASSNSHAWSYIDSSTKGTDLLPSLESTGSGLDNLPGFVTPLTWGNRPIPIPDPVRFLVAISPQLHDEIGVELLDSQLESELSNGQLWLVRSRRVDFSKPPHKEKMNRIFMGAAKKKYDKFTSHLNQPGGALGFEFITSQQNLSHVLNKIQQTVDNHKGYVYVSDVSESKVPLESFFENMAVM